VMGDELLRTDRLVLRRMRPEDADDLLALDDDPQVMRFINGGAPADRTAIEQAIARQAYDGGLGRWVACERVGGAFVGWFGLIPILDGPLAAGPDVAELGYRLRRAVWGRGLATEGGEALVAYGFDRLGLRRIVAQTMTVNTASRRVMDKLGLTYVRTFHMDWPETIEGTEEGDVEYGVDHADWRARRMADGTTKTTKPDISL
jgi:RimJ/RimL family protein N-acetyltransferase